MLSSKITGPGQRATLSAMLSDGMKAVTIRVNDVEGVAGFVLPGERVDVVLTRTGEKNNAVNDVVLQNVRVLAVDQLADQRADKPAVVQAVTLEVDPSRWAEDRARRHGGYAVASAAQGRRRCGPRYASCHDGVILGDCARAGSRISSTIWRHGRPSKGERIEYTGAGGGE